MKDDKFNLILNEVNQPQNYVLTFLEKAHPDISWEGGKIDYLRVSLAFGGKKIAAINPRNKNAILRLEFKSSDYDGPNSSPAGHKTFDRTFDIVNQLSDVEKASDIISAIKANYTVKSHISPSPKNNSKHDISSQKLLEEDMENLIIENPKKYLGEEGLILIERQYRIGNYIFDLLFEDRHGCKLIVEIQRGTLDRNHTYKIFDYYDEYKEKYPGQFVELMIVANKIPRERRNRLSSHGIECKEIPLSDFLIGNRD